MKTLYIKRLFFLLNFFLIVSTFIHAQETVEIFPNIQSQKKLKLCAGFTNNAFRYQDPSIILQTLENAIDKYKIDVINAHHFSSDDWVSYKGYDEVKKIPNKNFISENRKYYQRLKDKGIYLIVSGAEPVIPKDLFVKYPEMKEVDNHRFWQFIEDKTKELYDVLPEMDCYEIYLWETPMVDDSHIFDDLKFKNYPFYSHADYFKYFFDALSRAAYYKKKDFMLLTFSHYPFQEQIMIDALKKTDRNYPFLLDHKNQPGDWVPFKPANNIMQAITELPAHLQFDGAGEYWGQSTTPYCYPEEIQARIQHALTHNQNINTLSMRINWMNGSLFGKPNEINFYALSKLAEDPFTPIEQIWRSWAVERFGEKSAEKVISALKRTDDIGRKIFYIEGMWVFNHSAFADLSYLESHVVNYAKCIAELKPWDIMGNFRMNELLNYPREQVINDVLDDRDEALRLNALSLQDIEDAKNTLKNDDYKLLKEQLTRQRDMARASKLQLESFFRYRIEKQNGLEKGQENRKKMEACLVQLEKMAEEMDQKYKEEFTFLKGSLLRRYVSQIRGIIGDSQLEQIKVKSNSAGSQTSQSLLQDNIKYPFLGKYGTLIDSVIVAGQQFKKPVINDEHKSHINKILTLPGFDKTKLPRDIKIERTWTKDGVDGIEYSWDVGYGPRTYAWLLRPEGVKEPLPGIVALHDHGAFKTLGKEKIADGPDEITDDLIRFRQCYEGRAFASELARRGFTVLVPDVFMWGSRKHSPDNFASDINWIASTLERHGELGKNWTPEIRRYEVAAKLTERHLDQYLRTAGTSMAAVVSYEDHLATNFLVSLTQYTRKGGVGCVGLSGGGARSALLQGSCDHIRAAVVVAMMGTYKDLLTRYVEIHTSILFPEGLTDFGDWPDVAGARSPSPLMVLYDRDDNLFSLEGMQDADKRLKEIYTKSGAMNHYHGEFFPGPHKFDIEMQEKAFKWLKANLQD